MFDYKSWTNKTETFISVLRDRTKDRATDRAESHFSDPPLTPADVQRVEADLRLPLPEDLRVFLETASSRFGFRYVWSNFTPEEQEVIGQLYPGQTYLYGGADLCPSWEMADHLDTCREWGEETCIEEFEAEKKLWMNSFPFAAIDNGDYLAISHIGAQEEGCHPVVYLSHDDESRPLSPSFPMFLQTWEKLRYIGPEIWMLVPFTDPMTGYLNAGTERAQLLRQIFKIEN
jgi:hypothetical protein